MQVQTENGTVIERSSHGINWFKELSGLAGEYPMLSGIDPYSDTVFNERRVPLLLGELDRMPPGEVLDEASRAEIRRLCDVVRGGVHLYLWFIGD